MRYTHLKNADLNLLLYLDLLLQHRSVTLAAQEANLTQSAMSRALGRLRQQFDDPLLVQSGRRLEPTPRALALVEPLRTMLEQIDTQLYRRAVFMPETTERLFSIVAPDFAAELIFAPLCAHLRSQAPGIRIRLLGPQPGMQQKLTSGALDLALGVTSPQTSGALKTRRLFCDPFVCVIDPAHHKLHQGKLTLESYVNPPHILVAPGGRPGGFVDSALAEAGHHRRVVVQLTNFTMAGAFITGTNLILTLPRRVAEQIASRFTLKVCEVPLALPRVTVSMLWHARHHEDPTHRWFRQQLCEIVAQNN